MIDTVGPYLVSRAFLDGMIDAGWGRIVSLSSAASLHTPGPLNSAYGTAKVALNQFTRHLAAELEETGVTANGTSDYFSVYCYSEQSGGTTLQASDNSNAIRLMYFNATKLIGV